MSIMMKVSKDGKLIGQCDKKCYDADPSKCHCVCGGMLHGKHRNISVGILRKNKAFFRRIYPPGPGYRIEFF